MIGCMEHRPWVRTPAQMSTVEDNSINAERAALYDWPDARIQAHSAVLASQASALLSSSSVEAPHPGLKSPVFVETQLLHF